MIPLNRVCLVEDDEIMGESLCQRFELEGIPHDWFKDGCTARTALTEKRYRALISDIRLPDMGGDELFQELLRNGQRVPPTLFITGFGTIDQAVDLLKLGARDYISKPFDIDALLTKLQQMAPSLFLDESGDIEPTLGVSPIMRKIETNLRRLARFPTSVLITGESGVGKEHAASYLHQNGESSDNPIVAINCAAVHETLLEAELFGHEKGAFTGATNARAGLFERADNGTLFLDEVGEMSLPMQAKLLRTLQEGVIQRVGGGREIPVNVRIICATNRDLQQMIAEGAFREDLFYRINMASISIPPLRERAEDIGWFAAKFLRGFCRQQKLVKRLSQPAERWLAEQPWPGNLRELKHAVERACIFSEDEVLDVNVFAHGSNYDEPAASANCEDLKDYMEQCECRHIRKALEDHHWRIAETAQAIGISRKSLWEKMRKHGVKIENE